LIVRHVQVAFFVSQVGTAGYWGLRPLSKPALWNRR
jgi:hypothetical protein